jgi:hypothetical protein
MAKHTSYRYELEINPALFAGEARVRARIENEAAVAETVQRNAQ